MKFTVPLYTNSKLSKREMKKIISLTTAIKRIQYLGNNKKRKTCTLKTRKNIY